jgi:flagellar motor switch protein FliM
MDEDMGTAADGQDGGTARLRAFLQRRTHHAVAEPLPSLPLPPAHTPVRAAAIAIGRAADRLYHLGVQANHIRSSALTLSEMPEYLPELSLLAVLQGPQDRTGVMALCPETVTALIEMQTMGQVTDRQVGRRRPTRSDAMLCADFINQFLQELAAEMQPVDGFDTVAGYRYASFLDDVRPLMLLLEDQPYRSFSFDLVWGGHLRPAQVFLALPQSSQAEVNRRRSDLIPSLSAPIEVKADVSRPQIATNLFDPATVTVDLVGVLARRRMNLRDIRALEAGKSFSLPLSVLAEARVETGDGQVLAVGKLGEMQGCHAIRLRSLAQAAAPGETRLVEPFGLDDHGALIADLAEPDAFRPDAEGQGDEDSDVKVGRQP